MSDTLNKLVEELEPKIKELRDSNKKLSHSRLALDATVLYDLTYEDIAHFLFEIGRLYHCGKYCNKEVSKDINFALECLYKSALLGNTHAMEYYIPNRGEC